jgi:hypothetical protein
MSFNIGDIVDFTEDVVINNINNDNFLNPLVKANLVIECGKLKGIVMEKVKNLKDVYKIRIYINEGIYLSTNISMDFLKLYKI